MAFGRTEEIIQQYTEKGSRLGVIGRLQTRSWDDKQSGQKKYITEVVANEVELLSYREGGREKRERSSAPDDDWDGDVKPAAVGAGAERDMPDGDNFDDELPF